MRVPSKASGEELEKQRWDDHRYYHHSRINQSLHLLSSISFLFMYAILLISPHIAALVGWILAMWSRQIGHFFFEPKTYDDVNEATHEYKEDIKVGYNLRRKVVLMGVWAVSPVVLYYNPTMFGLFSRPHTSWYNFIENMSILWLIIGVGGLLFRTIQLFFVRDVQTGLVWATKIITDPFNDFKQYRKAPIYLLKGELIDPMSHVEDHEKGMTELEPEPVPETA